MAKRTENIVCPECGEVVCGSRREIFVICTNCNSSVAVSTNSTSGIDVEHLSKDYGKE